MKTRWNEFTAAREGSNLAEMTQALDAAEALKIESPYLEKMRLTYALKTKDWPTVEDHLKDGISATLMQVVANVERAEGVSEELLNAIVERLQGMPRKFGFTHAQIATIKWKLGEKEEALASAQQAVETIKTTSKFSPKPFEEFAAAMKAGEPMRLVQLSRRMQAAAKKSKR